MRAQYLRIAAYARITALQRCLAHRTAKWWAVVLGVLLSLPCLGSGFAGDDYIHQSQLHEERTIHGLAEGPFDLFVFAPRDPEASKALIDQGLYSWWTDPNAKVAFFRPLSAATHVLDYTLWPDSPVLMHVHTLLWFVMALALVAQFYHRLPIPAWVATLATLLYAIDDVHGPALSWLASRNALVALVFSLGCLIAHDAWRRDAWMHGRWCAPGLLGVGLLAGEAALATLAYLVAHGLFLDSASIRARIRAALHYIPVLVAWSLAYMIGDYGTRAAVVYLNPIAEPIMAMQRLGTNLMMLLYAQLAGIWSELYYMYAIVHPALTHIMLMFAIIGLTWVAFLVRPLTRSHPCARFFAFGMVLSTLPFCLGPMGDRLLFFTGLGGLGLLALFGEAFVDHRHRLYRGRWPKIFAGVAAAFFVYTHLLMNLMWLPVRSQTNNFFAPGFTRADHSIPAGQDILDKTVVLVNPPTELFAVYMGAGRDATHTPRPRHVRILSPGTAELELRRIDAHTVDVRCHRGFLEHFWDRGLRAENKPFVLGTIAELSDVTISITELTDDDRPANVRFRFTVPLEHPTLVWLQWQRDGFVPFSVPAVGTPIVVPGRELARVFQ